MLIWICVCPLILMSADILTLGFTIMQVYDIDNIQNNVRRQSKNSGTFTCWKTPLLKMYFKSSQMTTLDSGGGSLQQGLLHLKRQGDALSYSGFFSLKASLPLMPCLPCLSSISPFPLAFIRAITEGSVVQQGQRDEA